MKLYQLADVVSADSMETKRELDYIIGKDFEVDDVEVGKQAVLNNVSDAHIFRRVTKTSIIENVIESFRELHIVAKDSIYILKKLN